MAISKGKKAGFEHKEEVAGLVFLAFAAISAISLVSRDEAANPIGIVGSILSWALFALIGYGAYIFPALLLVVALKCLLRRYLNIGSSIFIGLFFLILASTGLLASGLGRPSGGLMGGLISSLLIRYMGLVGSYIFLATLFLVSVIMLTGLSIVKAVAGAAVYLYGVLRLAGERLKTLDDTVDAGLDEGPEVEEKTLPRQKAEPQIITTAPEERKKSKPHPEVLQERFEFLRPKGVFQLPSLSLLDSVNDKAGQIDRDALLVNAKILEKKLKDFDVDGTVVEVRPGPVVTMYEFEPAPGIKIGRIVNLDDDLALAMRAVSIRIVAPIPGKAVVGIEVPNQTKAKICFRELLECPDYAKTKSRLTFALGRDISGMPYMADLVRMPHLLIAGATGAGKSVALNAMILSILFKATPDDVRFLMIDPKMLELSAYEGIPHLLTPVITDPKKAAGVLRSIVHEMGKRYKLMAELGVKNIEGFNRMIEGDVHPADGEGLETGEERKRLPYIVVIIDELADLMMTSGKDVEECLVRLSQMARASGIHLLLATQRPSVDVITGLIKTNFPARISFQMPSKTDSRTILDASGAETLLGDGDMLFLPPGSSKLQRVHGVYVSEPEIKRVTEFLKKQARPVYDAEIAEAKAGSNASIEEEENEEFLRRYDEAKAMALDLDMISTSYIQRRFRIGYNTAARIIERMESEGIVGPAQGSRPREVIKRPDGSRH
ncbi:MAG: DNA translocase FtsK 4TM domain-containing protein [Deltaproteobacteria bacterium]|nr:DNA translocase FtsK 4TM domain-containing protein [Deltaproteobacteria bacterium]